MIPEAACIGDAGHDCDLHSRHIKTSCAKAALWEAAEREASAYRETDGSTSGADFADDRVSWLRVERGES